jgi:putative aminopeptidase FrvX
MADRTTERRWLDQLTSLPTAPGREDRVMQWVRGWVSRRPDLVATGDVHGNLLVRQRGRRRRPMVVAVAHTDHPGFVVEAQDGRSVAVEFRGGVRHEYFADARVELFDRQDRAHRGSLTRFDHERGRGEVVLDRTADLAPGDIGRWLFGATRGGVGTRFVLAPACDDLAGAAACLAALDRARGDASSRHFAVLLTRAEEVGFVGAIGACRDGTVPSDARILSIECSRSFPDSPLGGGPVVRVGDRSSVFDHRLTNLVSEAAEASGLDHQRRLMSGGSCEATAFIAYGFQATGLCLPLGNYHNMGHLDEVERGRGLATPLPEVVSLADFDGLVRLLGVASAALDRDWGLRDRLEERFARASAVLE